MKILFFYRGAESFGIEQISAVLKEAGHKTELVFDPGFDDTLYFKSPLFKLLNVKDKILSQARSFSPDLIAFSSTTNLYPYVKEIAYLLKKELKVPTIIGGIHATVLPDYVLKENSFDIVCVGEGEYAMLELADRMQNGRDFLDIENLWFKHNGKFIRNPERPLIEDLDNLPFPDKDMFYNKGAFYKSVQLMISRGCLYRCSFCVNSFYFNRYGVNTLRRRSPDNIMKELKIYKEKYGPKFINFQDDVFNTSIPWLQDFGDKYEKEIGVKYLINIYPTMVNKAVARLLKESGCWGVCMGIQSGNEAIRRSILKRNETNTQIIQATRILKEFDIRLVTEFIFSLPNETPEEAWESVILNDKIGPDSTSTFVFYPFPGAELSEYSYRAGLIDDETRKMINEGIGSYHTATYLKNSNNAYFLNIAYLLPLFAKFPWFIRKGYFKKICARKTNFMHRMLGVLGIPFSNPFLFKEKLLNYMRMFWVYFGTGKYKTLS